jgi:type IV secretory pathway TrbF-like protein
VVSLDRIGNAGYVGKPTEMSASTMDLVREQAIRRFVGYWRTVTSDQAAATLNFRRSFHYIGKDSSAYAFLHDWFTQHDPIERAKAGESVTVQVQTIERESDNTVGVWFTETHAAGASTGQPATRKTYRCRLTYAMKVPESQEAREENPLGVLITEIVVEEAHQ